MVAVVRTHFGDAWSPPPRRRPRPAPGLGISAISILELSTSSSRNPWAWRPRPVRQPWPTTTAAFNTCPRPTPPRHARAGIRPSVGAVGSSYDCEDDGRSVGGLTLAYDW